MILKTAGLVSAKIFLLLKKIVALPEPVLTDIPQTAIFYNILCKYNVNVLTMTNART